MSQSGFSQVSGSRVLDSTGQLLSSGTISFTPILDDGSVTAFQAGGNLHGQVLGTAVYAAVTNGAFSVQLADTALTNPVNISYLVAVTDNVSGNTVLQGSGYRIQPTGASWNFDTFIPTLTPQLGYILSKGDKGDTGSPGSFGPTVKTATQLGCVSDGVTDCGPIISSFFANASPSSPKVLLLDAPGLIAVSTITLGSNGFCSIVGMGDGTGFYLLPGAFADVISIGFVATNDPGGNAPTISAQDILLRDFRIDGNRGGQHGNWNGVWTFGINLVSCQNVRIENVSIEHASTYSIRVGNVSKVLFTGCRLMPFLDSETVVATNTDGIHIDGPASDIIISNCYFRCGDDSIALNAPEGYGGQINRVAISNCTLNQSQTAVRIYAQGASANTTQPIDNVSITNLTGSVNVAAFVIGIEAAHTSLAYDGIRNISISGVNLSSPRFMLISDNIGTMTVSDCTWSEANGAGSCGMFQAWYNATTISNLSVRNCRFMRDSLGNAQNCIIDACSMNLGGSFKIFQLNITGFAIEDLGYGTTSMDYASLSMLNLNAASFVSQINTSGNSLRFGNLLLLNGAAATAAQHTSAISTVCSTDLLHMAPIPDAIAYVGTLYYSLDHSNALSVNLNGTRATLGTTAH